MLGSTSRIVLLLVSVFGLNQAVELSGITIPILHEYLDDVLCLPIVLSVILVIHRQYRLKCSYYILPFSHILLSVLVIAALFEIVLPNMSPRFTGDPFDVLAYMLGALIFVKYINVPQLYPRTSGTNNSTINVRQTG